MDIKKEIEELISKLTFLYEKLSIDSKKKRLEELNSECLKEGFWDDVENANKVMEELNNVKKEIEQIEDINLRLENAKELFDISNDDELKEIEKETISIKEKVSVLEIETLFDGEYDNSNAYMEIHSGAGGTESNDWADMIYRMYIRYFNDNGFKYEIINEQPGEEVGIKGAFIQIKGKHAFGKLKGETGVHRLVRISPFDANKRRHTSFASVLVTPEINSNIDIDIKESDLKVDVYRSSGAGGQSVNTTDSAVRMTHIPTNTIVTVQNERSQIKNKEKALEILKSKLFLLEKQKLDEKLKDLKGDTMDVNFGSAIRSYVMCPYTLVKDVRTGAETANVKKVLGGDINIFIEAYLKGK